MVAALPLEGVSGGVRFFPAICNAACQPGCFCLSALYCMYSAEEWGSLVLMNEIAVKS